MERMDARQLNHHAAALAVWAYAVAQLPELLPRDEAAPPAAPAGSASAAASPVVGAAVGGGIAAVVVLAVAYALRRRFGWCAGGAAEEAQYKGVPAMSAA